MAQLKQALATAPAPLAEAERPGEAQTPVGVLKELEAGNISYDQALDQIKRLQKE
jgi:hypothetical protein